MPLPGHFCVIRFIEADHFDFRKEPGWRLQKGFLPVDVSESGFVEDLGGTEDALLSEVPEWRSAGLVRATVAEIIAYGATFDLDPDCPFPALRGAHGGFGFPDRGVRNRFVAQLDRAHLVRPPDRFIEFKKQCPDCRVSHDLKMELGVSTREPGNGFECIHCQKWIDTEGPVEVS